MKTYIRTFVLSFDNSFKANALNKYRAVHGLAGCVSMPENALSPFFLQRIWRSLLCLTVFLSAAAGSIYAQGYCASTGGNGGNSQDISNVQIGTLNNSSNCSSTGGTGSIQNSYSDYTNLAAPNLPQLNPLSFSVGITSCTNYTNIMISIWIDYNQNGSFDAPDERVYQSGANADAIYNVTGSFIIPESALLGPTRMRVIASANTNVNPCGSYRDGETEDYTVNITGPVYCSGTPAPGSTLASQTTVCSNETVDFSFSSSSALNNINATGFTYQWFNNAGPVSGATNPTYTATITTTDNFYCKVTCSQSGQTGQSTPVAINLTPYAECYCTSAAGSTTGLDIFNVTAGTLNNSTNVSQTGGPGSLLNRYSDFTTLVAAPVFNQLATIPFSIQVAENGGYARTSIWIDYNHNGIFESPDERVYQTAESNFENHTLNGSFTIPITALTGTTRMRIITTAGQTPVSSACGNYGEGETEDYLVSIAVPVACSGSPVQTNTIATQHLVCPEAKYTFSLSPSISTGGTTYQWYNNAGLIAGATNETYTATITSPDEFYCDVTCPTGEKTTRSIPVSVLTCYCTSTADINGGLDIYNVTAGTLNHSTTPFETGGPGSILRSYSDFTTLVNAPVFNKLATIPFSVTVGGGATYAHTAIWIDYNRNGIFESPGEFIFQETGFAGYTATGSFTIPQTALTGVTRMRIVTNEGNLAINSACQNYGPGETEDYLVNIAPSPPCGGFPLQTNTIATQNPVCPQVSFTFSLSPSIITSGNTYQWYNDAGLIAGATHETYTAIITSADNFYCDVTCPNGENTTRSIPVAVREPYLYCPCTSVSNDPEAEDIFNVTIGELNNSSNCGSTGGAGSILNRFSDYTSLVVAPNLAISNAIPVSIQIGICNSYEPSATSVWIDYNHNGSFDSPEERVYYAGDNYSPNYTLTGSITIPETALLGLTRMRVICGNGEIDASACGGYGGGETEDYFVNIVAPTCSDTPTAGNTVVSQNNVCANTSITLSLSSPPTITNGITYQWFNNGGAITGATDATCTTTITTTGNFYCEVTCTSSSLKASSTPVTVNVAPVSLPTSATTHTQNVATTPLVVNNCQYIAKVVPTTGFTDATIKSWTETTPPFIYVPRHYEITPGTNPNTATGTVTLYYSQADFNAYNGTITSGLLPTGPSDAAKIANFQILKYAGTSPTGLGYAGSPTYIPGEGNSWNTGAYTFVWNATNSIWEVTFPVTGFSGFLAKSIAQPLPVTLISFTGKATEKDNELNWKTSSEVDFSHFEIQRSVNAKVFEKIGIQEPNASGNYTFLDSNAPGGKAYYRLKMIDRAAGGMDGTYSFSRMIAIENDAEKSIVGNFYPNPGTGKVYIEIKATEKGIWNITTYDLSGKVISFKSKFLQVGLNKISIEKLNIGLNVVKFENGIISETRKVIKE
ncbi:GEVED domain-containing protein [Dyadobacter chenwenxiniae]|uniref:GEVED domain-containing protein n=1 Tax=Dyadobacter chenwenxiniae TaxID=2906456 RepID=A0A9X1TIG8_9BACT|nr:GEVED domain-containing protein [Dyadobacter chenwenxiniae]MCF0065830.1 GEVED domain-containing protein [Dyadobacter chenwenxiniae]UON84077.1 GEVED domain-containing protein [Dyadobacter chenwenxiniae]